MAEKEIKDIFEDCLQRLLFNGESIENCLAAYPQHADELKPLLITALSAKQTGDSLIPRPEFKARARNQFYTELNDTFTAKKRPFLLRRFRFATTALTAVLVMVIASGSLVAAASSSMPDSPLYSVKLAVEQVRINLTFSDIGKAKLYSQFSDRRVEEIIHMAEAGNAELAEAATNRLGEQLVMIGDLTSEHKWESISTSEDAQKTVSNATEQYDLCVTTIAGGTVKLPPPIVTGERPDPITPTPTTPIPPDVIVGSPPPYVSLGDFATAEGGEVEDVTEFLNLMFENGNSNSARLRSLLDEAPDSLKPILLQAIALLESGYQDVIDNIIE